ncbi:MAG: GFA family protein [Roseiarcus sp.]|jgi:hypothetical protein
MPTDDHAPPFHGGCQCGAVRYALAAAPKRANICHCRMCQKAGGAPFMAFAAVSSADFRVTRGALATFASSDIAERGFCAACGTPLTYHLNAGADISVTIASLDDPAHFAPARQLGVEARLPWFAGLAGLPELRMQDWLARAKIAHVGNRQHPDRETPDIESGAPPPHGDRP